MEPHERHKTPGATDRKCADNLTALETIGREIYR
jgi:hypothetical protein